MKNPLIIAFGIITLLTGSLACKTKDVTIPITNMETDSNISDITGDQLKIRKHW